MKSVFQEDSSVVKAIEKAWNVAGRPKDFTVKIIDFGKKGILGFAKKPAIISVTYSPKKQTVQPEIKEFKKDQVVERGQRRRVPPVQIRKREEIKTEEKRRIVKNQKKETHPTKLFAWSDELLKDISGWLKELFDIVRIKSQFDLKINKKILNVSLAKSILRTKEEEKAFFIGVSYVLMQFLKKKYKKKFDGFHVIINSPLASNESSKSK